jgi:hypothetical protein
VSIQYCSHSEGAHHGVTSGLYWGAATFISLAQALTYLRYGGKLCTSGFICLESVHFTAVRICSWRLLPPSSSQRMLASCLACNGSGRERIGFGSRSEPCDDCGGTGQCNRDPYRPRISSGRLDKQGGSDTLESTIVSRATRQQVAAGISALLSSKSAPLRSPRTRNGDADHIDAGSRYSSR